MWHKPCRTFHPWCLCIKTRCLFIYCLQSCIITVFDVVCSIGLSHTNGHFWSPTWVNTWSIINISHISKRPSNRVSINMFSFVLKWIMCWYHVLIDDNKLKWTELKKMTCRISPSSRQYGHIHCGVKLEVDISLKATRLVVNLLSASLVYITVSSHLQTP